MNFNKLLDHCLRNKILDHNLSRFSFLGDLLQENLRKEWMNSCVIRNPNTLFVNDPVDRPNSHLTELLVQARNLIGWDNSITLANSWWRACEWPEWLSNRIWSSQLCSRRDGRRDTTRRPRRPTSPSGWAVDVQTRVNSGSPSLQNHSIQSNQFNSFVYNKKNQNLNYLFIFFFWNGMITELIEKIPKHF